MNDDFRKFLDEHVIIIPVPLPPKRPPITTTRRCGECGRSFDLTVEEEASEWFAGHDCE